LQASQESLWLIVIEVPVHPVVFLFPALMIPVVFGGVVNKPTFFAFVYSKRQLSVATLGAYPRKVWSIAHCLFMGRKKMNKVESGVTFEAFYRFVDIKYAPVGC
jgi:hypothetical protein